MKKTWGKHNLPAKAGGPKHTDLTDRERKLAHGMVGGLTNKAALQKAGYAAGTISNLDSIMQRPRFVRYLTWLRERQVERLDYSIDNIAARLEHVYHEAMFDRQFGPATQAMMGIAKLMGHLADRTEIEMHIISKPVREPTNVITLSPQEWQEKFAPKRIA